MITCIPQGSTGRTVQLCAKSQAETLRSPGSITEQSPPLPRRLHLSLHHPLPSRLTCKHFSYSSCTQGSSSTAASRKRTEWRPCFRTVDERKRKETMPRQEWKRMTRSWKGSWVDGGTMHTHARTVTQTHAHMHTRTRDGGKGGREREERSWMSHQLMIQAAKHRTVIGIWMLGMMIYRHYY